MLTWHTQCCPSLDCITQKHSLAGGSVAQLCLTLGDAWTAAREAPPSAGFSRQEYWSGLPCPSPGDLPSLSNEYILNINRIKWRVNYWKKRQFVMFEPPRQYTMIRVSNKIGFHLLSALFDRLVFRDQGEWKSSLIHVNLWQGPLRYCKVISLQLKLKKKKSPVKWSFVPLR